MKITFFTFFPVRTGPDIHNPAITATKVELRSSSVQKERDQNAWETEITTVTIKT